MAQNHQTPLALICCAFVTRGHQFKLCKLLCPSAFIASTFWHRVVNMKILLQPHPWQCLKLD